MFVRLSTIVALSTISLLDCTSAAHSRFHRHLVAREAAPIFKRDVAAGSVEIPIGDLQLLRTELTAFQAWMRSWISTANASDTVTNLAQLELEFQAYDGWMTAWLDSTLSPTPEAPPPLPSSVPITTSSSTASIVASPITSVQFQGQHVDTTLTSTTPSSTAEPETTTKPMQGGESFQSPPDTSVATTLIAVPSPSTVSTTSDSPSPSSLVSSTLAPSPSTVATPNSQPIPTTNAPSTNPPSSGPSTFDAQSSNNLAVYYGQSPATSQTTLAQMCQDDNVDIVILAFLTTFFGAGGYPAVNLGAACGGPSQKMQAAGASGLLSCPNMENDIKTCQGLGKKILLSLGGAQATTAFSSDSQASDFATKLWNLFGGGNGENAEMRPFGSAVVDGFDIDNEDHSTAHYTTFISALRTTMSASSLKPFYLSAAPQCPRPDASIPLESMQSMDFIFIQFYNNGACNLGQPGFAASLDAWSRDLSGGGSGGGKGPKLYIGAPGCEKCAGSGYLGAGEMARAIQGAKGLGLGNLGGVMLWDGPEGKANLQGGVDYLAVVKGAMG
ncbi:MAG: hypothetical protein Q9182_000259 [Xanthomendoza sp. 2 TL-2023]